jgi:hypothetical protein
LLARLGKRKRRNNKSGCHDDCGDKLLHDSTSICFIGASGLVFVSVCD